MFHCVYALPPALRSAAWSSPWRCQGRYVGTLGGRTGPAVQAVGYSLSWAVGDATDCVPLAARNCAADARVDFSHIPT